jgi:hypothetical protein
MAANGHDLARFQLCGNNRAQRRFAECDADCRIQFARLS